MTDKNDYTSKRSETVPDLPHVNPRGDTVHTDPRKDRKNYVPKPGTTRIERYENIDDIPKTDVSEKDLRNSGENPEGWLLYGNNYRRHHHTTADIITPENVSDLSLEWETESLEFVESGSGFQGSPIVVPGDPPIIYQVNSPGQTRAINARTGDVLWYHKYYPKSVMDGLPANRGVGVLGDTVYKATLDYGVLALNRYNANEKWYYNGAHEYRNETARGPKQTEMHAELESFGTHLGNSSNYPMIPYEGGFIMGSYGADYGVQGWAEWINTDGEQEWRTGMVPPDKWVGDSWKHGGGTVWQAPAIDPESDTAVIPTGNPGPWFGTVRPGWNEYTAGKVALNIQNGEVQWDYQETPHDWWDYDSPSPAFIFEAEIDGEQRKLASWPGKTGWVYTVDLETGKLIERSEEYMEHINTWTLPAKTMDDAEWQSPDVSGGTDPQPSTYDPDRNIMVLKGENLPMKATWEYVEFEIGYGYHGVNTTNAAESQRSQIPGWDRPHGNVTGIDPVTGEVKWQDWRRNTPWGGAMSTTTGITFVGTGSGSSGTFTAYNTETGEHLWSDNYATGVDGNPVSWVDPGTNKQYVYIQGGRNSESHQLAVYSMEG